MNSFYALYKALRQFNFTLLLLIGLLLAGGSVDVFGQTTTVNFSVCHGGVTTGSLLMDAGSVPGGQRSGGQWTDTGGLTFSDLGENPVISGFSNPPGSYTIKWRRNNGRLYIFNISVSNNPLPDVYMRDQATGSTSAVLMCNKTNVTVNVVPNVGNPVSATSYQYFVTSYSTGGSTASSVTVNASNTYTTASYNNLDYFSALVTGSNGCRVMTNRLQVSSVSDIQVQVVGGASVCKSGTIPAIDLEVVPYNIAPPTNFIYTWYTPSGTVVNSPTVTVNDFGNYYVRVEGCGGNVYQSNTVAVIDYDIPAIQLNPLGSVNMCYGSSTSFTATPLTPPVNPLTYDWYHNEIRGIQDGLSNTYTAFLPGDYKVRAYEASNLECYTESNLSQLYVTSFLVNQFGSNTTFCGTITPSLSINATVENGTSPISVTIRNTTAGTNHTYTIPSGVLTFVSLPSISATSAYQIVNITANGCAIAPDILNDIPVVTYTREPDPIVYSLTGTANCEGVNTIIGLNGSQLGVTYMLLRNSVPTGISITGTGAPVASGWTVNTAGNYTVSASIGACPAILMSGNIMVRPMPIPVDFINTGLFCPSGEIGLQTSYSGTTYTLYRSGVSTGITRAGNTGVPVSFGSQSIPGVYTIRASTGGSCFIDLPDELTVQEPPTVYSLTANKTNYCSTAPLSGVTLTLSGSQSGLVYRLFNGAALITTTVGDGNPISWNNQGAGSYTIVASNDGGCNVNMAGNPVITALPVPTATISVASATNRRCEGTAADFRIGVALTGIPPFNFQIVNNAGLPVISVANHPSTIFTPISVIPNQTVTYTIVNLTDGSGCALVPGSGSAQFFVDPLPSITFNPENPELCFGSPAIPITAQGAGVGGTYSWSDGLGSNQTIFVSPPVTQTYTVTAQTVFNCSASRPVTVTVNPLPVINFAPPANDYSVCQNGGIITFTPVPLGGSFTGAGIIPSSYDFNPAVAGAGSHNITYTYQDANTCVNTITKTMVVTAPPAISISSLQNSYCADDPNDVIVGNPTNNRGSFTLVGQPAGVVWNDNGNGTMWISPTSIINSGSGAGTYTVRYSYTDLNGCISVVDRNTLIQEDLGDVVRFRNLPATSCQTAATVTLQAFFDRAVDVDITTNDGLFTGPGITDNGNGTATFDPSVAGNGLHTVQYVYTDPLTGCTASYSRNIQIGTVLNISNINPIYCLTDGNQPIWGMPSGGTMRVYRNSVNPVNLIETMVANSAANPVNFNPSVALSGTYIFVYELWDGSCANEMTYTTVVHPVINPAFSTVGGLTQFCQTTTNVTFLPVQPGGTFSGTGVSLNVFNPSVAGPGNHVITHTINTGSCSASTNITLSVIPVPVISIVNLNDEYCDNDPGPYLIQANNMGVAGAVYTFSSTTNGIGRSPLYTVDGFGVRTYASVITAQEVYFDPIYVGEGFYTVTFSYNNSANNGCSAVYSKIVTVHDVPEVNFGGVANPVEYCQDGGLQTLTGSFVGSGNFTGSGGFMGSGIIDVNPNDGIAIFNPSLVLPGLHPVVYTYTLPTGCVSVRAKDIRVMESPAVYNITPPGAIPYSANYCEGGAGVTIGVDFSQNGITYQLIYNNNFAAPVQTLPGDGNDIQFAAPVTIEGNYTVRAVTASGCYSMMNGSVQVVMNKVATAISTDQVSCHGGNDGRIVIAASGGSVPYVYRISTDGGATYTNSASNVFSGLVAGTYHIQVTDQIGCTLPASVPVVISQPTNALAVSSTKVDVGCLPCIDGGDCDGLATISISGGTPFSNLMVYPSGYNIVWRNSSNVVIGNGLSISNKLPGTYTATVTDAEGCTVSHVVEINLRPVLTLVEQLPQHVNILCNGAASGAFGVTATGGSGAYEFSLDGVSWFSNGTAAYLFTNLTANTYNPRVRDAGYPRCVHLAAPVVITQPAALSLTEVPALHINVDCFGGSTGQLGVVATGGSNVFEYSINNGVSWQPGNLFTGLVAGTYYIWVRDAGFPSCIYQSVVATITQPAALNLSTNVVNHVTCFGGTNGSISVTAVGGSGNYGYSINGGVLWQTSSLFNNLPVGAYQISLRDESSAGCVLINAVSVTINQPQDYTITENAALHQDVSCFGGTNGSFTVTPSRVGNFQYTIDGINWQVSPVFNNLTAGGYQVSVRDMVTAAPLYCTKSNVITVVINQPVAALNVSSVLISPVTCFGGNNGSISVTLSGGTAPYYYQWYRITGTGNIPLGIINNGTTSNAINLASGSYLVEVIDDNGCQTTASYFVSGPLSGVAISIVDIIHVTTLGGNNGAVEISVGGESMPYLSIIWSGVDMGGAPVAGLISGVYRQENLVAGIYEVSVTDANGCISTLSNIVVSQPGMNLGFVISKNNPAPCYGAGNGTINLSVVGGISPYKSIELSNSSGTVFIMNSSGNSYANYTGLYAGVYIATVVDANDISYTETIVLFEPDIINLNFSKIKDVTCFGEANGQVSFRINGGTPFPGNAINQAIPDNPYYNVLIIPSIGATRSYLVEANQNFLVNDLTADNNYQLTLTDMNGCPAAASFGITQPLALAVNLVSLKNISCFGGSDGEISVSVAGRPAGTPFIYNWQNLVGGIWTDYQLNGNSVLSNLPTGSYRVTVIEMTTGCETTSGTFNITQPFDLLVQAIPANVNTCRGDNSGSIAVTVSGGVAPYVVDYGLSSVTGNGPVFNINSLPAGPYTITVTDNGGSGCVKTTNVVINEPLQSLTISNFNANINCETINTGFVSFDVEGGISNASGEFSYTVSLVNTGTGTNYGMVVAPTVTQPYAVNINNLPAGNYLLTVTDRLAVPSIACSPYTRNISLAHVNILADVVNATCSGVNTGEIKNFTITGGSGNYIWNWSSPTGGLGIDNANLNQTGLSAGTYVLQLTDVDRGCMVVKTYNILFANNLQVTGSTKGVTCAGSNDGAIFNINVTGVSDPGLSFIWSGPDIGIITVDPANPNISNLSGGTYLLTVVDGNGCTVIKSFNVAVPAAIQFDLSTTLDNCDPYERSISLNNLTGGTGIRSFVWNGPGGFNNTVQNLSGLNLGGTYSVTVFDENFCQVNRNISIPGAISVDATIQHINCGGENNATIVLHVAGGSGNYSYLWSTADGSGISATAKDQNGLTAGTYTVVVTDNVEIIGGSNCFVTKSFTVTQPLGLTITGLPTHVLCAGNNNGAITLNVTGGTGSYIYNWSSANGTGLIQGLRDQGGLSGGTYSVLVQDSKGCNAIESFTVNEPNALDFTILSTETDCTGTNRIEITAITGGSGSYLLTWAGPGIPAGFTGTLQDNLPGGIYTIRLTDTGIGQLCTIEKSVTLARQLQVSSVTTTETCPGELDGTITLTVSGGLAPFTYNWTTLGGSPVVAGQKNQGGLSAGVYMVQVTDARACMVQLDVTITHQNNIDLNAAITNVTCYGAETGAINLTVTGGSGNFTYQWTSAGFTASTKNITGLRAGGYTVVITDNVLGCQVSQSYAVTQPATPITVTSANITQVLCNGSASGAIDITVAGGTPPYSYQWSTTSGALIVINSEDQFGLVKGSYQVRITDVLGCFIEAGPYIITEPALPMVVSVVDKVHVSIPGESTGAIEVDVTGGSGNYTYLWERTAPVVNVLPGSVVRQSGLSAGVYRVIVTDQNGCVQVLENIIITEPGQPLTINSATKNVRPCHGSNNGEILIQVVGGTPDMGSGTATYQIVLSRGALVVASANDVSLFAGNLEAGWYSVVVTDANGVTQTAGMEITQPPIMPFTVNVVNHVTCNGGSDAVIRVNLSGGYPAAGGNYQVQLLGPGVNITRLTSGVNEDFTGLPIGNYTILVWDDADGDGSFSSANPVEDDCFKSQNISITQPEAIASLTVVPGSENICEGVRPQLQIIVTNWSNIAANPLTATLNDGTVVTVNNSPFIFQPATAPASDVIIYTISALEADGTNCLKGHGAGSAQVIVRPLPTGRIFGNARICAGATAQIAVELTGTSPWSITYSDGTNSWTVNNINTPLHLITVSPAASATYQLISVSDAYCSNIGTGTSAVAVDELPMVTLSGDLNPVICRGASSTLSFNFSAGVGPWVVTYTDGSTTYTSTAGVTPYVLTINPLVTTTYSLVSVTDQNGGSNSCSGTVGSDQVIVTVNQYPNQPNLIIGSDIVCQGSTHNYSVPVVTHAVGYIWDLPVGATIVSGSGTNAIQLYFDPATSISGYLRVRGTNSCGTGLNRELYINVNRLPAAIGPISGPAEMCQGTTNAAYSVPIVADGAGYTWVVPAGFTITSGQGTASILVSINPNIDSFAGQITVTPFNACGVSLATAILDFNVYPLPTANAGLDENICSDTYTLNATPLPGGWTGRWEVVSGMGSASILNPNSATTLVTGISRGDVTFRWTVTHAHAMVACSVYDDVTIRNNTLAVHATSLATLVCNGETQISGTPVPVGYINTTGLWQAVFPVGSAATFDVATSPVTNVRSLAPGLNRLRWTLTQNGCQSYAEIEIVNNKPDQAVIFELPVIDLCTNLVTLTANVPVEGVGQWSVIEGFGAFSNINSAVVTVSDISRGTNIFRWTITKGSCSTIADVIVRNNTLNVSAGTNQLICTANTILNGTPPPVGTTGQWTVEAGGAVVFANGTLFNTAVSNLGYDDNILRWTITKNGCQSSATVTITSNRPTTAVVGSMQTICGATTTLTGNTAIEGTGRWSIISGSGVFADNGNPVTEVSGLGFGNNVFRWTISKNGCSTHADLTIHNLQVYVYAGKDTIICGRITQLQGNVPAIGTGQWQMISGMGGATFLPGTNVPNPTVGGLGYGANGFRWTITNNGCVSSDEVVVVNNAPYPVDAGGNQVTTSPVATLNATPTVVGTGTWVLVSGGGDITNPADPFSLVTNLRRGDNVFRWTVTHMNCTEFDDVTITNGETIDANAGRDQEICTNFTVLEANDPDVAVGQWSVVSGAGTFENVNNPRTRVTNVGIGANVFRWTIYYTLSQNSDDVIITNNSPDQANAGYDDVVCDTEFQLRGNAPRPNMGTGLWTLYTGGGIISDVNLPNPLVTDLGQGVNRFIYTITKGSCVSTDEVSIINGLPTIAYAGNDEVICVDYINLKPNTPTYGVGNWRVGSIGSARFDGNWARDLAPGPNILIWEISTGYCTSTDEITIINNSPSVANAGQTRDICQSSVTLSATPPIYGTGTWELVFGSGVIANPTNPQTLVTGLAKGENNFRWTVDNNGCKSVSNVVIRNNLVDANAGTAQILCADNTSLLANNPLPGIGTWGLLGGSGSANFDDLNNPFTTVRNLDQGVNILTWTIDYKGCKSVSQVSVTNNNPTKAFAGSNDATCSSTYLLAGNIPSVGAAIWTILEGGGDFSSDTDPSATVSNLKFGTNIFRWTIEHQNCVSFADVKIDFNRIDAAAGGDRTICASDAILEGNSALPGVGGWSIPGGDGAAVFDNIGNPTARVTNLRKGTNLLRWTITNKGCVTFDDVVITNSLPSESYAGNKQTLCSDVTQLDATAVTIGTGRWTVGAGSGIFANDLNPKTNVTGLSQGDNLFIWTVTNGLCSLQDQVLVVNNRPSEPYAGLDYEEVCENAFQLKAATPDYGTGQWTFLQGGGTISDFKNPRAVITFLNHGTNRLRWTITAGQCALSDEIRIENNTPTKANAGSDIEDCKNWQLLDANAPVFGTGFWERISGYGDFVDASNPKTRVNNLGFGPNIFRWNIVNGNCSSTDEVIVFNKIPDVAFAGSDQTICENYTVLNANLPVTGAGTWQVIKGQGVFTNPSAFNTTVTNVGFGENIYQWKIHYGDCVTTDEVIVLSNRAFADAGEDQIVYAASAVLNANNVGSLNARWYVVGASSAVFDNPAFFNTRVTNLSIGINTFRWEIDVSGCVVSDLVSIDYRPVPNADFITDVSEGCYPLTVRFTNYSVGGTVYHWNFGDGNSSGDRNPVHTFTGPGRFTVTLRSPGPDGRDGIATKVINVFDHPVANFTVNPQLVYVPGDNARFYDMSTDAVSWLWQFGDGNTSAVRNPSHKYQDAGFFDVTLIVTNRNGCTNSLTKENEVEAVLSGFIIFPNAFRPRPGVYDAGPNTGVEYSVVFKPVYRDVDTYLLQIFNRWGQLIYESTDIDEGWDGLYNGQLSPQAVYVFKASGKFVNGREYRETGSVLLVR